MTNNNCTEYARDDYGEGHPFYLVPNAYTFRQISETDKRDAIFGAIQWRPSDQFNINLDVQYSDRTFVESRRDLNISEARRSLTDVVYDENGIVQSLSGQSAIESNGSELSRAEEYLGGGLSVEWQPSDRLTLTVDGSYSRTIRVAGPLTEHGLALEVVLAEADLQRLLHRQVVILRVESRRFRRQATIHVETEFAAFTKGGTANAARCVAAL